LHEVQLHQLQRGGALGDNGKFGESTCPQPEDAGENSIARFAAGDRCPTSCTSLLSVAGS
jgi:hypothetical protein